MDRTQAGQMIQNNGSTARDFCMLERNFLSHVKLALLLTLISCSIILRARLIPEKESDHPDSDKKINARIPLASLQAAAALLTLGAGAWEYHSAYRDLRGRRAFFGHVKPHLAMMSVVVVIVFATGLVLLIIAE